MLYHAQSLAACGVDVDLVGYSGALPRSITDDEMIRLHFLHERRTGGNGALFLLRGAARVIRQSAQLAWTLLRIVPRPDVMLAQVPPALPALAIVLLAARLRRARVVVDWHNLTSSVLALRLGERHVLVRTMAVYERAAARFADGHLCVSRAMADTVSGWRGTKTVHVFRDRAGDQFARTSAERRGAWQRRIAAQAGAHEAGTFRIVAVPTSWGLDDDFDLLRDALDRAEVLLEERTRDDAVSILIVLTGLGPLRERYKPLFEARAARRVRACAIWLTPDDYVELLGCADLGVSVHRSASGLDLPMKICDLFGAGVPVCALDYASIGELVEPGVNGLLFSTAEELAGQMCDLLAGASPTRLARLATGAAAAATVRWREGWTAEAWPVLRGETGPVLRGETETSS
jgi:beta-1,4-mannosyltransferase